MSIRSRSKAREKPEVDVTPEVKTEEPIVEEAALAEVKTAAALESTGLVTYVLKTPYQIVSPEGVRFFQDDPTPHPPTRWMQSNVDAKIFEIVKQ